MSVKIFNKIDYYIIKKFFKFFLINLAVFLGILWLTKIIDFLQLITDKQISLGSFFYLSILTICKLTSFIIPLVSLVAAIFTFNHFYYSKEIFVFKSAGLSRLQIVKTFMFAAILIVIINYLLVFFLAPFSEQRIRSFTKEISNQFLVGVLQEGQVNKFNNNIKIFIDKKNQDGTLSNIIINYLDKDGNLVLIKSFSGKIIRINEQLLLMLRLGKRILYDKNYYIVEKLSFNKYITNLDFYNEKSRMNNNKHDISTYYINQLFNNELLNNFSQKEIISEIQQRILWPWLSLSLILLIITILLKGEYSRKGNLVKNIFAILSSLAFLLGYFLLTNQLTINLVFVPYFYIIITIIITLYINHFNRITYHATSKNEIS
jgi:lipopolysaccharide export system permease protein